MAKEDMIRDWLEGKLTADELQKRKHEAGTDEEFDDLQKIIEESSKIEVPQKRTKEEAWGRFLENIEEAESKAPEAKVRRMNPLTPIGIAAAIALLAASYFVFFVPQTVVTKRGEQLTYQLPDGSEVTLNADSEISFARFNWKSNRTIELNGEAFFDVKQGESPFIVTGAPGSVKVVGTSFNAYLRDKLKVSCYTGKVWVKDLHDNTVELNPGERVLTEKLGLSEVKAFDNTEDIAWKNGEFYFENASFTEVLNELERQYDVEVVYEGDASRVYTGYFTNKDLDEALQLVFKPMSLNYRKENSKIIVE